MKVMCHIAGPSGSGKTSLVKKINSELKNIVAKDLDDFDDDASKALNLNSVYRKNWTAENYENLAGLRKELMNKFIDGSEFPIVFAGSNREGDIVIDIPTDKFFLIDIDAKTSAQRAFERSQNERPEHRRMLKDLPFDEKEAQDTIDFYVSRGYEKKSIDDIFKAIAALL